MARNRLVDRAKAAATRSAPESPTESHQRRYQSDLAHEIGPTTFGRPLRDGDDRDSFLQIMTQPAMIMILAIITFALTFIVLMWRDGRLDHLFVTQQSAGTQRDPKAWMLGRNADGVIEDTNPSSAEEGQTKAGEPAVPASPAPTHADKIIAPTEPADDAPIEETAEEGS